MELRRAFCVLLASLAALAFGAGGAVAGDKSLLTVDPFWPKPLPNNWILGQVAGVAVDSRDHIWILQRPGSLTDDEKGAALSPPISRCCVPAPPVIEFDQNGEVVRAWGGPGQGHDWPSSEHGIYVDYRGNVWIAGAGDYSSKENTDNFVLKFSPDGKLLLEIGRRAPSMGSNDTRQLGRPADIAVDPATNEVYVADGYGNRRVIVFDADTGQYKRHWGAYGQKPSDEQLGPYDPGAPPAKQFQTAHCVVLGPDGHVYVCDRSNNRIQVFRKDGAFVREEFFLKETRLAGSVSDLAFLPSAEGPVTLVADLSNNQIHVVDPQSGVMQGSIGRSGRNAGQFHWLHGIATDSQGHVFTAEVETGKRVQKFVSTPATAKIQP